MPVYYFFPIGLIKFKGRLADENIKETSAVQQQLQPCVPNASVSRPRTHIYTFKIVCNIIFYQVILLKNHNFYNLLETLIEYPTALFHILYDSNDQPVSRPPSHEHLFGC